MVTDTNEVKETALANIQYNDNSIVAMRTTARIFAASGMFPDARTEAQAYVKIMAGREMGLPAMFSMTKIYVVEGKVMAGAEVLASKIKSSGKYDYKVIKHDNEKCVINFYLVENGKRVEPPEYISTFTMDDARDAKLVKPNSGWEKWKRAMLYSKALSQGARIVCPDVINGIYTPEEFGIEADEDGKPRDMSRVITITSNNTPVDTATGEVMEEEITQDLAKDAHTAVPLTDQAPKGICPIHRKPFKEGTYGWYCATKMPDGKWCKEKPKPIPEKSPEEVQKDIDDLWGKEETVTQEQFEESEHAMMEQATVEAARDNAPVTPEQCEEFARLVNESGRTMQDMALLIKNKLGKDNHDWDGISKMKDLKVWQLEALKKYLKDATK